MRCWSCPGHPPAFRRRAGRCCSSLQCQEEHFYPSHPVLSRWRLLPKALGTEDGAAPPAKPAPEQQGGAACTERHGRHVFLAQETQRPQRPAGLLQAPCQQYPLPTQELSFPQSRPRSILHFPGCCSWQGPAFTTPWSSSPWVRVPAASDKGQGTEKGLERRHQRLFVKRKSWD